MRRLLTGFLYLVLVAVVLSTVQTLWVGITNESRYQEIFPRAAGSLYWVTLVSSGLAGLNAVFIGLRKRWAVWLNPLIGLSSIALLGAAGGHWANPVVVLLACLSSTLLPYYLWMKEVPNTPDPPS